jgi:hypothetical protein
MGLGDIGNAFLIVLIFCIIQLFITLSVGLVQLRNNWDKYKCNPGVTPFAGFVGFDPVLTFQECTKETQGDFMNSFLSPVYDTLDTFAEAGNVFTEVLDSLKLGLNVQQDTTFNVVEDLGNRLKMLISGLSNTFITVLNVFGKTASMMSVIYYLLGTATSLGEAIVGDLPGTAFRMFTGKNL